MIINLSTSQSVETRISQLSDYFTYINENYKGAFVIGSGIGTPYLSLTQTEDLGETKIVDLENSENRFYKFTFQVPVLFIFKYAGLVGLIWFLTFWFILVINVVNDIRKMRYSNINIFSKVEFISIGIYLMFFSIFWGSVMLGGTTPFYIFLGLLIGRYTILRRKIYL
mgnify:FL=1